jgi:hypothetical protein
MRVYTFVPTMEILGALGINRTSSEQQPQPGYLIPEVDMEASGADPDKISSKTSEPFGGWAFQYLPETVVQQAGVRWAQKESPGPMKSAAQYAGMQLDRYPLEFVTTDHWGGPPKPFKSVMALWWWFNGLVQPIPALGRPPWVKCVIGEFIVRGVVESLEMRSVNMYPNLSIKVSEIRMSLLEFPLYEDFAG